MGQTGIRGHPTWPGPHLPAGRTRATSVEYGLSGIFRAQNGIHYGAPNLRQPTDVGGDGHFNEINFISGRNHVTAPPFVNMDMRIAKRFDFGERVRLHAYLEFFNLFNRANPAAVNPMAPASSSSTARSFGQVL